MNTLTLWPNDSAATRVQLFPLQASSKRPLVLVLPGGGYGMLADHEGEPVARRFNELGYDAAVLYYRVAPARHPAMIHDAQRAVRVLRDKGWNQIGVLGFSAGGHLTSTLAVHFDRFTSEADDLAASVSARPDAVVLCYPVIHLIGPHAHDGSCKNLLGPEPSDELIGQLTTVNHVRADGPPTFLWHTAEDEPVPMQNSLDFAAACRRVGLPVELHVYESGRHGLGLALDHPQAKDWPTLAAAFLRRVMPVH